MAKILAFAGSTRRESFNGKLLRVAVEMARDAGAEVTVLDLADFDLPLFNQDLEAAGVPKDVTRLKQIAADHDAFLIASPEYNASVTPLMKNVIDWMSRKHGDEPPRMAYSGKVAAIVSASPGAWGGSRAQPHLQFILQVLGVTVVPQTVAVKQAGSVFDDDGQLTDEGTRERLNSVVKQLIQMTDALSQS